jgi:hypothetical protein
MPSGYAGSADREVDEAPELESRAADRTGEEVNAREHLRQRVKEELKLKARKGGAEAEVDPAAKREV